MQGIGPRKIKSRNEMRMNHYCFIYVNKNILVLLVYYLLFINLIKKSPLSSFVKQHLHLLQIQPKPTTNGVAKERLPERESRESRESRDTRDSREMRESRDSRESRDESDIIERRASPVPRERDRERERDRDRDRDERRDQSTPQHDGRHPLLQFAVDHFRQSPE